MRKRAVLLAHVLVAAAAAFAAPASAQSGGGTAAGPVSNSSVAAGGHPTFSGATSNSPGAPDTSTITVASSRTILNMASFDLSAEDTLNIVVSDSSDRVYVRVPSVAAVNGRLIVTVGPPTPGGAGEPTNTGGSVWISGAGGVAFGANARVAVGGLLATSGNTADADFFNGLGNFSGAQASISIANGATVKGNGGVLAFVASQVTQASTEVGGNAEVLYGGAASFSLGLAASGAEVERFLPGAASSSATPIDHAGTTTARDVFVSALSSATGAVVPVSGVNANGFAASGDGNLVISAGGGFDRPDGASHLLPTQEVGAAPHKLSLGTVSAAASLRAAASGDVELSAGGTLTAQHAGLSTGATFVNGRGAGAMNAVGKWLVRAPSPTGHTFNGLDSQNRAIWGAGLDMLAPNATSGNRYAFASVPELTFTSLDAQKFHGQDGSDRLDYSVTGLHPGVSGAFAADDEAAAFSGSPELRSDGASPDAAIGTYPIEIARGTLAGVYSFAFDSAGEFSVVARPARVAHEDFSSTDDLTLSGSATPVDQRLRLTDGESEGGAAFTSSAAVVPSASFSTSFRFRAHGGSAPHGDGMAFVLQTDPRGAAALGTHGGMLGYGYGGGALPAAISPSLVVEFDMHDNSGDGVNDPSGNHVGIALNGDAWNTAVAATPDFEMFDAEAVHVWVDYDAAAEQVKVYVSDDDAKPETPLLTHAVDLQSVLGGPARAGFTASTGGFWAVHDVLSWRLSQLAPSSTSVSCSQSSVDAGAETTCTATVSDTSASGKATPAGPVAFGGAGSGKSCNLVGTGTTGVAACGVGVSSAAAGSATVSAQFDGGGSHEPSSGSTQLTVALRGVSVSVSCADQSPQSPRPDATPCEARVEDKGPTPAVGPTGTVTLSLEPGETKQCELAEVPGDAAASSCGVRLAGGSDGDEVTVSAAYAGDPSHEGGKADTPFERVTRAGTTTGVSCPTPAAGQSATACTVIVSDVRGAGASGTDADRLPGGSVSVQLGAETKQCTLDAHAGSTWQTSCAVSATAGAAPVAVAASYPGSATHRPSAATSEVGGVLDGPLSAGRPGSVQVGPSTVDFGKSKTVKVGRTATKVPIARADCDPRPATSTCTVQLQGAIEFAGGARKQVVTGAAAKRRFKLPRARFVIKAGQVKRLTVRLPAKARKRLRSQRKATMKIALTASSDAGLKKRVTRTVKLRMR